MRSNAARGWPDPRTLTLIPLAALLLGSQQGSQQPVDWTEIPGPVDPAPFPPSFEAPPDAPLVEPSAARGCGSESALPNVYLHSGEFHLTATDLSIPGRGLDFVWARKYRSRLGPTTAQGNGWDFSYNIRIRQEGQYVRLFDGNTRRDLYLLRPGGIYSARQFFREGKFNLDGTFRLTFADAGTWNFKELDGAPAEGKIESIIDRNGNALQFQYDGLGRLVQVLDTLNRAIAIGYDGDGRIRTVTDFAGRVVRYAYYAAAEPGGSLGDLKSMTTPAVTGFPLGKTTTYTYSKGFADERLNHNLLTITDPLGQAWLANTYSPILVPKQLGFDRIVRQRRGDPGDDIKIETELIALSLVSAEPIKVIVNDRVGNVEEWFFDRRGRATRKLEFTGRADPTQPTTSTTNRPVGPLRLDDPPSFETLYRYNDDSLVTRIVPPNGNVTRRVYELALDPNAPWRMRGNLRELRRTPGTHTPAGDQPELVELYEYQTGMGGCCGVSFVKRHVDARGNETLHTYDSLGNRLHTQYRIPAIEEDWEYNSFGQVTAHVWPDNGSAHMRRDEFVYYGPPDGAQNGYLKQAILDAPGLALTTTHEYDAVGNVVRKIDPRGNDEIMTVNALNQVEAERSREWTTGSGNYTWKFHTYDADDNRIRLDVENRDESGVLQPNALLTTTWTHGILNEVLSATREIDTGSDAVTEYEYDAHRNRTLVRHGEATNGNQPANTETTRYDERDLVFQVVRAAGSADPSTAQTDYDGNRNVRASRAGLESGAQVTEHVYDSYDRRLSTTDSMGNVTESHYDANGNLGGDQSPGLPHPFATRVMGELVDAPGSVGNVRLAQAAYTYDALDRRISEAVEHFDPATQLPTGDGQRLGTTEWEDIVLTGQVTTEREDMLQWFMDMGAAGRRFTDDHGHVYQLTYDTANRRRTRLDPAGNSSTWSYDANGNVTSVVEVDVSDLGSPSVPRTTTYAYDNLDRLIQRADNAGNTIAYAYDSRDNRVLERDPRGNETRYLYDGLERLIQSDLTLTDTGTGGGLPIGSITTSQGWDDSSRLTSQGDGNGNGTQYEYDALDRRIRTTHADGTQTSLLYDAHDVAVQQSDANGSAAASAYDALERLTGVSVVCGPGVSTDTTFEVYQYDGLSRLVLAEDDDSLVTRTHDSLGNQLQETSQVLPLGPIRTVSATYDAVGNQTRLVYPGGRTIVRTQDELERDLHVQDQAGPTVADFWYLGPLIERTDHGNGTRTENGHDGVRRRTSIRHSRIAGNVTLDQRTYGWDPASNKAQEVELVPAFRQRTFAYDSADRLVRSTEFPPGTNIQYLLDSAGNRQQVIGGANPGPYTCDGTTPEPADCQMNQYTTTPADALIHDRNGNLIRRLAGGDVISYLLDARNRPVQITSLLQGLLASYRYDVFARRIERTTPLGLVRYLHDRSLEIEEQDAGGITIDTVVVRYPVVDFSPGAVSFEGQPVDFDGHEPAFLSSSAPSFSPRLQLKRGGQSYYYHGDDLGSVILLTDDVASCVERATYGDFGEPQLLDCFLNPIPNSIAGNSYLYRGWRHEVEGSCTGDWRFYAPRDGRCIQRDASGIWSDVRQRGNALALFAENPVTNRLPQAEDPRPSVATVDTRGTHSGGPSLSFFDVFVTLDPVVTQTPRPPCEGPCSGVSQYYSSEWVTANSWQHTKNEAQKRACKEARRQGENEALANANDVCRQRAKHGDCLCAGTYSTEAGPVATRTLSPRWARQGMGFGKTPQEQFSCRLRYDGQCAMNAR